MGIASSGLIFAAFQGFVAKYELPWKIEYYVYFPEKAQHQLQFSSTKTHEDFGIRATDNELIETDHRHALQHVYELLEPIRVAYTGKVVVDDGRNRSVSPHASKQMDNVGKYKKSPTKLHDEALRSKQPGVNDAKDPFVGGNKSGSNRKSTGLKKP